jgi:predicted HTH domain antitoxin
MKSVTLQLPDEIAEMIDSEAREPDFIRTLVLALVLEGKLGAGKAAQLLGLHLTDFVQLMAEHGVPYYYYDVDDWQAEEQTLQEVLKR